MKTLKQNFKSDEGEDRQEEIKNIERKWVKCRHREKI